MSDNGAARPGYFAPVAGTDELQLRGFPANICHEGDVLSTLVAEMSRRNSEALVRAALGRDLDADLTVSGGHAHDDRDSDLTWMAAYSFCFTGDELGGASDQEAALITAAAYDPIACMVQFAVPLNSSGTPLYRALEWRVRARVPATLYTSCALTLSLDVQGYNVSGTPVSLATSALTIAYDFQPSGDHVFISGPPLFLEPTALLAAAPEGHLVALLRASVDVQAASIFELQLRWK
jgi:hypothetical protein